MDLVHGLERRAAVRHTHKAATEPAHGPVTSLTNLEGCGLLSKSSPTQSLTHAAAVDLRLYAMTRRSLLAGQCILANSGGARHVNWAA